MKRGLFLITQSVAQVRDLRKAPLFIEIPKFPKFLPKRGHILHGLREFFSLKIVESEVDPPDEGEDPCSGHPGKGDLSANNK